MSGSLVLLRCRIRNWRNLDKTFANTLEKILEKSIKEENVWDVFLQYFVGGDIIRAIYKKIFSYISESLGNNVVFIDFIDVGTKQKSNIYEEIREAIRKIARKYGIEYVMCKDVNEFKQKVEEYLKKEKPLLSGILIGKLANR